MILKSLLNTYNHFAVDLRTGTFKYYKSTVAKNNSPVITKTGARIDTTNYYKCGIGCAIGTQDFTVIVKRGIVDEHSGLGTLRPLYLSGGNLRMTINGSNYDSTSAFTGKFAAVTADRDGNATFFQDGIKLGDAVDISGSSSVNIGSAVYTFENDGTFEKSDYAFIFCGVTLTTTQIAQLYGELENAQYDRRSMSKRVSSSDYGDTIDVDVLWKPEFYLEANERTITAGEIENTGIMIDSGSHKITWEDNAFKLVCVTDGDVVLPVSGDVEYTKNGVRTSAASTDTISLVTDDEVILSDKYGLRDLVIR